MCRDVYSSSEKWRNCTIEIGGLAIQGPDAFRAQWNRTYQDYLTSRFQQSHGLNFVAHPLTFNENFDFVGSKRLDFIYSNPGAYTCMSIEFSLVTVASMINLRKGIPLERFAGVIFARNDSNFTTVEDLRRARVEAVSISGLGAMQLQQAELLSRGLNVMTDVQRLIFSYSQNKIVQDVESGYADVGFVRTDMIDRSEAANKTKWEYFRVINEISDNDFPFKRSTDFTPEWPIGALTHVPYEIMELVGNALMQLDSSSSDPELAEPATTGKFQTWVPPMNYYGLLDMLERIGYYSPKERRCLRSSDVYQAVNCPAGYVKKSETAAFCDSDCKDGYTCLCQPCTKLKDPELVLRVESQPTQWSGTVDVPALEAQTSVETQCERMGRCGQVATGQRVQWVLLDQIGEVSRRQINAPLLTSVEIRLRFDAAWSSMRVENVTLEDGSNTQQYTFNSTALDVGTQVVQIRVNGVQAEMSPVVMEHFEPPQLAVVCGPGEKATDSGLCEACPPGSYGALEGVAPNTRHVCMQCPPGQHQPEANQSQCLLCGSGRAAPFGGASECEACLAGRSTVGQQGASACQACEPGQEASIGGQERCSLCPRGKFSSQEGASSCSGCDLGMTTPEVGARNASFCGCEVGSYFARMSDSDSYTCLSCPDEGADCPGFGALPLVQKGFYMKSGSPRDVEDLEIYRCRSEEPCPGGEPGVCAPHHDSDEIACGVCEGDAYEVGGTCRKCADNAFMNVLPLLCVILAASIALMLFGCGINMSSGAQTHSLLNILALVSLVVSTAQTFCLFRELAISWFAPLDALLNIASFVSFELDATKFTCVFGVDPVQTYASRQCIAPAGMLLILLALAIKRRYGKHTNMVIEWVNTTGALLNACFISVLLSAVTPVVCYSHPNSDSSSVRSNPSILCFESNAHTAMLTIGMFAVMIVPLPFGAFSAFLSWKFPELVNSTKAKDAKLLQCGRFLFIRFKPEQYFFGPVQLVRSTLICFVPVFFTTMEHQVVLVMAVQLMFMLSQQALRPWRSAATNVIDGILSAILILILLCASLANHIKSDLSLIQPLSYAILIIFLMLCAGALGVSMYHYLRRAPMYSHFICHHKVGAAAQARLIKMRLQTLSNCSVFVDSDDLRNLDTLFDTVKSNVQELVVYLTRDTLTRPWCAGEIATAFMTGKVRVTAVWTEGFSPPEDWQLDDLESYVDLSGLAKYGLTVQHIQDGFLRLLDKDTRHIKIPSGIAGNLTVDYVVASLTNKKTPEPQALAPVPDESDMLIVSVERTNQEAVAAANIFFGKISDRLLDAGVSCSCNLCDYSAEDFSAVSNSIAQARGVLIFLSGGTLRSLEQLLVISESSHCADMGCSVVPVLLPDSQFPDADYYKQVLPLLLPDNWDNFETLIRDFFKLIAAPLSTHASDEVLNAQSNVILERITIGKAIRKTDSLFRASSTFRRSISEAAKTESVMSSQPSHGYPMMTSEGGDDCN